MARVLITGGRAPAALDLARKFDAAGRTVFAADSAPVDAVRRVARGAGTRSACRSRSTIRTTSRSSSRA